MDKIADEGNVHDDLQILDCSISARDLSLEQYYDVVARYITKEQKGSLRESWRLQGLEGSRELLIRLATELPRIRGCVSPALFELFRKNFDARRPETFLSLIAFSEENKWEEIKQALRKREIKPEKQGKDPNLIHICIEGKRILVVGGSPQKQEMYQRKLWERGASWVQWVPGKEKHRQIGSSTVVDIVVLIRKESLHKTEDAICSRISNGKDKIIPLDSAGEGFIDELIKKLEKRARV